MRTRPTVLSVAGYDPSGGAGLLADIKTFEAIKVYGLGVMTAVTWQNESEFEKVEWLRVEDIISQLELLLRKSKIDFVKIGLVENVSTFGQIVDYLGTKGSSIKIIWDPILKASAGFDFHSTSTLSEWINYMSKLHLFTPNWNELNWLSQMEDRIKSAEEFSKYCHVFLKGGHREDKLGYDYLAVHNKYKEGKTFSFQPKREKVFPKHGSGCVLSSAITAYLAKGYPLPKACLLAKEYVTKFLASNESLLGYHKI